jgi:hypothetical protein
LITTGTPGKGQYLARLKPMADVINLGRSVGVKPADRVWSGIIPADTLQA